MPPHEEFPTKGEEAAPSNDIGWHFGTPVLSTEFPFRGITRFKEHIAHKTDNVAPCPKVTGVIGESKMNILKESNTKKIDKKRITNEFLSQLRGEEDKHEEFIDEVSAIRKETRETRENHGERTSKSIPYESEFTLRGAIPELARSKSSKQPKISGSFIKTLGRKIGYFLNPQFQFGVEHSKNVLIETLEGTRSVIERLEPSLDTQVRMVNQLLLFRDKHEIFGTPQAQRAWKQMNSKQNLSHSSFSATPSQSGDGTDGGGLSPIDDDDGHSGDRCEIRSSIPMRIWG
ncbi:hypothetical protein GOBAR_DD28396 [Gossypium barbadense]|nr:hypothetical protein GOBAR_DD28396 [Gossypium barbadense]